MGDNVVEQMEKLNVKENKKVSKTPIIENIIKKKLFENVFLLKFCVLLFQMLVWCEFRLWLIFGGECCRQFFQCFLFFSDDKHIYFNV